MHLTFGRRICVNCVAHSLGSACCVLEHYAVGGCHGGDIGSVSVFQTAGGLWNMLLCQREQVRSMYPCVYATQETDWGEWNVRALCFANKYMPTARLMALITTRQGRVQRRSSLSVSSFISA